ncbi:MAG: Cyclohexanone monooxygenase [Marmoricola sp.]|nr:Cyclohexanone monooxygenase [Marmoricola sp.]
MTTPRIVIIGAGFGGIGTAVELIQHGYTDVTLLERADEVGGVWRDNTYPGAACDVPSSLYSWSFAPNPEWPRRYSGQADILDYIDRTTAAHGIRDRVRTGVEVTSASYQDETSTWRIETSTGETLEADFLVSAVGQLSRPAIPVIPGAGTFAGPAFHSAQWDHSVDLTGKRVAVLGTGASAIQFVPAIQPVAGQVTVFQRSAPYVVPKTDRAYTGLHRRSFTRYPVSQAFGRGLTKVITEQFTRSLAGENPLKNVLEAVWKVELRRRVKDPVLRAKLVPDFAFGCKRVLFSNDWYPALAASNVDVVTDTVVEILPHGVRDAAGVVHAVDVIIYGTGFTATEFLAPMKVTGAAGLDLNEAWAAGARAFHGICLPGFPNFGIVYGPNTNLGGSSIILMLEAQSGFIRQLVAAVAPTGGSIVVRPDAEERFDAEMQGRLAGGLWAGCDNWYRDATGRITTNWPGTVTEYQARTATVDLDEFVLSPL